ncbi:MAG: DNA primase [Hyphomicrobiaceae bacterium]|nr:MAG: DNA primase [Hyphomicrobiaceae bacterium]
MTDLYEILQYIDPATCSYEEWVTVGMGLQYEGGSPDDWDQWSARDSRRYKPGECAAKWRSFHGSTTPVTAGTLVELAKRNGWRPTGGHGPGAALDWDARIERPHESLQIIDPAWVEDIEVAPPAELDWNPAKELATYISTLFEASEYVGYVVDSWTDDTGRHLPKKGNYTRTAGDILADLAKYGDDLSFTVGTYNPAVGAWIRFNPLDGQGVRDDNVTSFRYALVESDTVPVDRQAAIYAELELPIAALVHSGGKSLHAIVRIGATSKEEYRERVNFLHKVCQKNGLEIDTQNKNPSRLSRMPGVVRNGHKQYLVAINQGKQAWEEWQNHVEEANDNLPDFEALDAVFHDIPPLAKPLIDGVLRQGHKGLLSGPSKAGKSYLLLQLALAIAEGRDWLGWRCAQGRVLYVNLELDRVSCLHRLKGLYQAKGWAPANIANIDLWNLRGKAVPMDVLAPKLIRRALKRRYLAVIIDPIYKVITGDENAADKMAFFCNQFDRVCAELGAAVIYCHHHSKGAQGQKSARDRSSGSGVFARDPDAILDIIELHVPDALRKQVINRAVCERLASVLDSTVPSWRDEVGQDDALVSAKMAEAARSMLGPGAEIDEDIRAATASVATQTGWRLEGTLREFKPFTARSFWFRHPLHVYDDTGALADAKADGEEQPWERERAARAESRKAENDGLMKAFAELSFMDGAAMLGDLADATGLTEKQIRARLTKRKLVVCDDGAVRTDHDAKVFRVGVAIEQAASEAPDGIATIGAVKKILAVKSVNTAREWVGLHPGYIREDGGRILPREATE